jgi:hypothetical protein
MENSLIILLQLLLAHILTDFVFQSKSWIEHKRKHKGKSYKLFLHALLAGFLTYLFLQTANWWYVALFISLTHYFIDWWKILQKTDNLKYFLLDQLFHLIVLIIVWLYLIQGFEKLIPFLLDLLNSPEILAVIAAYLIVIFPAGFLIGKGTKRWQDEIEATNLNNSLEAAGRFIGIFERILVLTFILTDNFAAIGFLIAAKSILRFGDKTDTGARKQTEYVLIGTLMSFAITILLGLLVYYFIF